MADHDVFAAALRESRGLLIELAYAENRIRDLREENRRLRAQIDELQFDAEMHECESCHDDCVDGESYDELAAEKERAEAVVDRLKDKRDAIYWERSRVPVHKRFVLNDFADQLRILDEILDGPDA